MEKKSGLTFCWGEVDERGYQSLNAFNGDGSLILSNVAGIRSGRTVKTEVDGMPFGGFKTTSEAVREIEKTLMLNHK